MKRKLRIVSQCLMLVLMVGAFTHCGLFSKTAKVKVKYPNQVTAQMEADYQRAEQNFKQKRYTAALPEYQAYVQRYPYNRLTDQSLYRIGQIKMLGKKYGEATQTFSDLIARTPDPAVASRARVKAGISQYRLKNYSQALAYFDRVEGQYIRRHDKIKVGGLALKILEKQNAGMERRAYYDALLLDGYQGLSPTTIQQRYGREAPPRNVVLEQLQTWAKTPATTGVIDSRFASYEPQASGPYINYKLGMSYYRAGNEKMAREYLGRLVASYGSSPLAAEARPLLAKLGYKGKKKKGKGPQLRVGAILPLSGRYERFGQSALHGMECSVGSRAGCSGVGNIQLVTRDDGGSPAAAVKAVEDLVNNEDVAVIVGPLSSASAFAAAKRAQELGVVMISLAQKEGIPQVGDNIFRFSLTPNQQVKALLTYSTKKKGKKLFGIFYPKTNYGKVFMEKFKNLAPSYGAEVTASHAYANSQKVSEDLRNFKFSVAKTSPEAPLGFNAIFIPDSYLSILNIFPQLKVSGLSNMLLLGTNAWNDPKLAQRSQGELGDVLFLDIYFKGAKNGRVKNFIREYQAAFGQSPSTLEAMGYDIIRFISQVASRNRIKKRNDFKGALMRTSGYEGVTGLRAFASSREARVRPYMLTVRDGQIQEVGK